VEAWWWREREAGGGGGGGEGEAGWVRGGVGGWWEGGAVEGEAGGAAGHGCVVVDYILLVRGVGFRVRVVDGVLDNGLCRVVRACGKKSGSGRVQER